MHGGGCEAAASGSNVQGQKSTLLDAAMKVEMGAEETSAIGGVMGECEQRKVPMRIRCICDG